MTLVANAMRLPIRRVRPVSQRCASPRRTSIGSDIASREMRALPWKPGSPAARLAREKGMTIIMGAPNVVRGGSHSGNVSAIDLAEDGLLDGLSSDYVPSSLLQAVFQLDSEIGVTLPDAVAMVSANVADVVGLDDRGEIATGKCADLVRVYVAQHVPVVREVWREGQRVA